MKPELSRKLDEELRAKQKKEQLQSKEDEKGAEEIDLIQYVTNLLYFVHNEGRNMNDKFFDKWVEESTNDLTEYFAQSHQVSQEARPTDIQINEEAVRRAKTNTDLIREPERAWFEKGAMWMREQLIPKK